MRRNDIRNLCIIAHVDHGKTTLVDGLLQQSGSFSDHETLVERVMDSNDLERERGITILAKNTSVYYQGTKLNIVDTPGHADFGGEVERILGTVDGAVLLVDAVEGPLPQTRFVLEKALAKGHKIILCINKVDRSEVRDDLSRVHDVIDKTFDLFVELGATEEQCEFPIVYACAREGWCTSAEGEISDYLSGQKKGTLQPLFELILSHISAPDVDLEAEFRMQLSSLSWSDYVGQLVIGRIVSGKIKKNQQIFCLGHNPQTGSATVNQFSVSHLYQYEGLKQTEVSELSAGDIGIIAGCSDVYIGDTLAGSSDCEPFPRIAVDAPTLRMTFTINTGPFSGKDGDAVQSRKLKDRLLRECRANVALGFEEGDTSEQFYLLGRGELQFAILIETMRREGLEFMVGRPVVMLQEDEQGRKMEPIETAVLDLPEIYSGDVTQLFQNRKGILAAYAQLSDSRVRLSFDIPTRGLIGIRSRYLTLTKGEGLFSSRLKEYQPFKGDLMIRKNGTLISDRTGKTTDYALASLEERGVLFIKPGTEVYEGMIIGECSRENDMNVNPVRPKKLTNVRSVTSDGLIILSGTRDMSLEQCIEWIDEDEWIECTPLHIRLRKKVLAANQRSVIRSRKK
ncbi:MAG: translational GTPase TypA [Deltaproteobacteria bacterium]|nr:translational GTPase TypA [Deltaproteobacteria bacterium]